MIRSIRRNGSAAPQSNWSPTVNTETYSPPNESLRILPIATVSVPVTAAGESSARVAAFSLGTKFTHWFASLM